MTQRSIPQKALPEGSFVRRILLTAFVLLIAPLFIHTLILYRSEYKSDILNAKEFLKTVEEERISNLERQIQEKKAILAKFEAYQEPLRDIDSISFKGFEVQKIKTQSGSVWFTRLDGTQLWVGRNLSSSEALGIPIELSSLLSKENLKNYLFPVLITLFDEHKNRVLGDSIDQKVLYVSTQAPIQGTNLAVAFSVPLSAIRWYEIHYYLVDVISLIVLIGIVGGAGVFLLSRRISRPFEAVCKTMELVSEGALHARFVPDSMGFEINTLGQRLNQMLDDLILRTQEAQQEKIAREKLAQELKIGREIQLSLLPSSLPECPGIELAPGYLGATEVSGDFYDFFPISQNRFLFVVADSAGKGISACLFALGFRSILRSLAIGGTPLPEMIQRANEILLLDTEKTGFFITAWIGLYDSEKRILQYCSQGHPPALLRRGDRLLELSTKGISFGLQHIENGEASEIVLEKGDFLLLFTDGVVEAHNSDHQLFGQKRLNELVLYCKQEDPAEFVKKLMEEIKKFSQERPQHDDITVLAWKM